MDKFAEIRFFNLKLSRKKRTVYVHAPRVPLAINSPFVPSNKEIGIGPNTLANWLYFSPFFALAHIGEEGRHDVQAVLMNTSSGSAKLVSAGRSVPHD